jgi:RND superfamily putative drug exporter
MKNLTLSFASLQQNSRFDSLNSVIRKRRRWIIIAWFVLLAISVSFLPSFFSHVSYNITGGFGGPTNTESQHAQDILNAQFPTTQNSTASNAIIVLVQGTNPYSNSVKNLAFTINKSISSDSGVSNYTGMQNAYTTESGLLGSSIPNLLAQVDTLEKNVSVINREINSLVQNLSSLSSNTFQLKQGVNQTAQLVYGIPSAFVQIWEGVTSRGVTNPYIADEQANATLYEVTPGLANAVSAVYYSIFYNAWNSSFNAQPSQPPLQRESTSVRQAVGMFLSNSAVNNETRQTVELVASGLNITNWNQNGAISNLTITTLASSIPPQLSTALGVSGNELVTEIYDLGPSPSISPLSKLAISLLSSSLPSNLGQGLTATQLLNASYNLGVSPTQSQEWNLASSIVANLTSIAFVNSPLFIVNSTSLWNLLASLSPNSTTTEINNAADNVISSQSYLDYPFVPTRAISENFISKDNQSTIFILNFLSSPDASTVAAVKSTVGNSGLSNLGTVYITGGPVITQDVQNVFTPALGVTLGPGIGISILIVGLLFLSPFAALIPIIMGGISIAIALPAIYFGIVVLGHGSITFLTPTLTTLLMLGLGVDYAVLQLRRTREERLNGKSVQESVGISVRWAGQAVLTAGITVIVAYVVMAVANVPLFSSVGTAIALGVSILLAASLTLLPSLELALGDRIFWPGMRRAKSRPFRSRLIRITEGTLKAKVAIAVVVSLIAFGAFYVSYHTPVGEDFLKLIPNFPSNQGLTALTNDFGGGIVSPTQIVVTTPSAIIFGANQFNQTILNEIEQISNVAANTSGVVSVTSVTRPYGSIFSYSSIGNLSSTLQSQYESGMLSFIGQNNRTTMINVGLQSSSQSQQASDSLRGMEKNIGNLPLANGLSVSYAGSTQQTYDSQSFLVGLLPQVVIILAAAVYVILFIQLRSAFTPLRLIFTILCSVVFSLAILSVIFKDILGLPILDFAPLFVVVTMLGVGIDYDIFLVTRIREEVLGGKNDNEAIKTAVDKVWVTILSLGLVLSTVFASLLITNIAILQEISLAVSGAIVLDVLIILLFFVPALMGLAEKFNWWPSKIGRQNNSSKSQ